MITAAQRKANKAANMKAIDDRQKTEAAATEARKKLTPKERKALDAKLLEEAMAKAEIHRAERAKEDAENEANKMSPEELKKYIKNLQEKAKPEKPLDKKYLDNEGMFVENIPNETVIKPAPVNLMIDPSISNIRKVPDMDLYNLPELKMMNKKQLADFNKTFTTRKKPIRITAAERREVERAMGISPPPPRKKAQIQKEAKEKSDEKKAAIEKRKNDRLIAIENKKLKIETEKIAAKKRICDAEILRKKQEYLDDIKKRKEECNEETIKDKIEAKKIATANKKKILK